MEDEKHYPPTAESERIAAEEAKVQADAEATAAADKEAAEAAEKAKAEATDAEAKAKAEAKEDEKAPEEIKKPRSIYDDYKEKKAEAKDATARAEAAEAKAAELQALLDKKSDATTTKENTEADADIETFLKDEGLTIEQVDKLAKVIEKRIGSPKLPDDVQNTLKEFTEWQKTHKAQQEDQEVLSAAPTVKTQLEITDDAELSAVMKEIVKLSHTTEFHDKEVEYIVWKKKEALSKLVSPKKKSFESGDSKALEGSDTPVDFSTGRVTPEQAQRATQGGNRATYEIKHAK